MYLGATKQPNNTLTGGHAAHVGQLYFDQPLLADLNSHAPYNGNTMAILNNTADGLFMMGANGDDPIVRYAFAGNKLENGMIAWIRFGINTGSSQSVSPAAWMTPAGGVMNPNGPVAKLKQGGFGGGGGFGFGGGSGSGGSPGFGGGKGSGSGKGGGGGGWGGWTPGGGKKNQKVRMRAALRARQEDEDDEAVAGITESQPQPEQPEQPEVGDVGDVEDAGEN